MNFRQIECFLLIAELHNFSRAAERLYITQSAATQQIRSLEDELGFSLFIRDKRNVELTSAGQQLYQQIRQPFETIDKAIKGIQRTSSTNHLTLAYYPVTKERIIPQLLQAYHQRVPHGSLSLERYTPDDIIPALKDHRVDLALLAIDDIDTHYAMIEFIPLVELHMVCIMPKSHPLAASEVICRDMLKGQTIALPRSPHPWKTIRYIRDFILPLKDTTHIIESDSGDGINTILASYNAITIRPSYAVSDSVSEVNIPLECDYKMDYGLAVNKDRSAKVGRFIKIAKDLFLSEISLP